MRNIDNPALRAQAADVTQTVLDVDGIITDGSLPFLPDGREIKMFNTLEGLKEIWAISAHSSATTGHIGADERFL